MSLSAVAYWGSSIARLAHEEGPAEAGPSVLFSALSRGDATGTYWALPSRPSNWNGPSREPAFAMPRLTM